MKGFVIGSPGQFRIDRYQRYDSLIIDEIILEELIEFLKQNYSFDNPGRLLDLGAGFKPYAPVYTGYFHNSIAVDWHISQENPSVVDVCASAERLPFAEGSFDCIICTEVLEHIPNPVRTLKECRRLLKPSGHLFITTPFLHPLHEEPVDFYRFTPYAYRHMGDMAGLQLEYIEEKGGLGAFLLLLTLHLLVLTGSRMKGWLGINNLRQYIPLIHLIYIWPQCVWLKYWKTRKTKRKTRPGSLDSGWTFGRISLGYVAHFRIATERNVRD